MGYYNVFDKHRITGQFGESRPYYKNGRTHQGIDVAYYNNEPLLSMIDGQVLGIDNDPTGFGNWIEIYDKGTGLKVKYGHGNGYDVKVGDMVRAGQKIGRAGSTGRSTGPHLHVQTTHNGKLINPYEVEKILMNKTPNQTLGQTNVKVTPETQQAIDDYGKKWAQMGFEEAMQNQKRNQETYEAKKQLMNAILSQKIDKPDLGVNSMEEVLNSNNKFGSYMEYLRSPEMIRRLAPAIGGRKYAGNGRGYSFGDEWANDIEAKNRALTKDYNSRVDERNKMLFDLMKELGVDTRAMDEMGYKYVKQGQDDATENKKIDETTRSNKANEGLKAKELEIKELYQNGQLSLEQAKLALENLKLNETKRHNEATENKTNSVGGAKPKEKELKAISTQLDNFERTFKVMPSKLNAMTKGKIRQKLGTQTAGESEFNTRSTLLFNTIARTLGGEMGVLSDQDIQRVKEGMPQLTDSLAQKQAKMKAIKDLLNIRTQQYGVKLNANPLGLNL